MQGRAAPLKRFTERNDMKASEIFGVAVRVIGLIMSFVGIGQISVAVLYLVGGGPAGKILLLLCGVPFLIIGRWFLRGAPKLIKFAYPEEE